MVEHNRHFRILRGEVSCPDWIQRLWPEMMSHRVTHHHAGMNARHTLMFSCDLHDWTNLVKSFSLADRCLARMISRHTFSESYKFSCRQQCVDFRCRGFGRPFHLAAHGFPLSFHCSADCDKFVWMFIDDLHVEFVGHSERWQKDTHINVVTFHVVE